MRTRTKSDAVGLIIWLPGLHNKTPGVVGEQIKAHCVTKGWQFKCFEYADHTQSQAQEGFTMSKTLDGLWKFIRRWRENNRGKPVVVIGSGFGAWVALLVATDVCNKVDGVIMFTPSLNMIHEFLVLATRKLPWFLRGIMRIAIWYKYAYREVFEYYVEKADGEKPRYKMPPSFLKNVRWNGFSVLKFWRIWRARMPILAFTPMQAQEGFLSSVAAVNKFIAAVRRVHGGQLVTHIADQVHLAHSGNKQLTAGNYMEIDLLLERATGYCAAVQ